MHHFPCSVKRNRKTQASDKVSLSKFLDNKQHNPKHNHKQHKVYYINKIKNKKIIAFKYFWQSIYAYNINNIEDFNKKYELFTNNECLYKNWEVAYEEYAEILRLISEYINGHKLNVEKFNYYKNIVTLKIIRKIFVNIELKYNE